MRLFKDQSNHLVELPVVFAPAETKNSVVHKILQLKIAFQQYLLTQGSSQQELSGESLETQLNRLAWRHKLMSAEIFPVAAEELRKPEFLPAWAKDAMAEDHLYLLAYRFSTISIMSQTASAMNYTVNTLNRRLSVNASISDWCRATGYHSVTFATSGGLLTADAFQKRFGTQSQDADGQRRGGVLTDMPFHRQQP
ncbi:MAG: hypothetical protein ACR2PT_03400 [Endozoicomonas sp.]